MQRQERARKRRRRASSAQCAALSSPRWLMNVATGSPPRLARTLVRWLLAIDVMFMRRHAPARSPAPPAPPPLSGMIRLGMARDGRQVVRRTGEGTLVGVSSAAWVVAGSAMPLFDGASPCEAAARRHQRTVTMRCQVCSAASGAVQCASRYNTQRSCNVIQAEAVLDPRELRPCRVGAMLRGVEQF